jgi:anti-sigma regulatory factor (Ser/Thr protein kinase)
MKDRIQAHIEQRTVMLAAVGHDLRTPLTRLKLELALAEPSDRIVAMKGDLAEMEHMIDEYLDFARGEGGEAAETLALETLIGAVVQGAVHLGAEIEFAVEPQLEIQARPMALKRALSNLVINAASHGRRVEISAAHCDQDSIEIAIEDDGPGIGGPAKDAAKSYTPGSVGVISRSGGMTTEMSSTLTAAGLGQSTAVSIGGDAIIGSSYAELMPLFEADEQTEAIVIYTEPGGRMEAELAKWVKDNNSRLPIVAFMAGRFMDEMPGMSFGHAGTIVEGKEDTATEKIARLAEAGIVVAEEISEIPELVKQAIAKRKG